MLQPGEKILVVSGIPGKKSHGEPPARDGMRTYHLFQREPLLQGDGTLIRLAMNQLEVARFAYDRERADGRGQAGKKTTKSNGGARMPKYELDIPHTLAPDEAKKRIGDATGKLSSDYGATCTWKSDNELAVSRKGSTRA